MYKRLDNLITGHISTFRVALLPRHCQQIESITYETNDELSRRSLAESYLVLEIIGNRFFTNSQTQTAEI